MGKLYYDAHAKNVIVKCKDGQDLETLIENGEIGGNKKPDPSSMIQIMMLSTVPNLDTMVNEYYTYTYIGDIPMDVEGTTITFYAYFRNFAQDESIPIGTVVAASYYNVSTVSTLGGEWEYLGSMVVEIEGADKIFYLYEKKA